MATKLIRGMDSCLKTRSCERQGGRAHPYALRFRDETGRRCEEPGCPTRDDALDRLAQVHSEQRGTPVQRAEMKRTLGKQRFGEYADN
ncbi:hypothetical protein [Streptomyces sp. NPDC058664]|uniref:hypothetical protein n=1 Tax=unclassified Streptomyces TaxID=2593676 RepID=UPI00365CF95D